MDVSYQVPQSVILLSRQECRPYLMLVALLPLFISAQNKSGGLRGSKASMLSWQRKCRGFQTKFPL